MKKTILIILVIIIGAFFAFFNVNVETDNQLDFLADYQQEIGYVDHKAELLMSSGSDRRGFRLTFNSCPIDTSNMESFGDIGRKIAKQVNEAYASEGFNRITLVFVPKDKKGIKVNEFISIDELKFSYETNEL